MHGACLVKTEKALNWWEAGLNRRRVRTDGNLLCQKALSLYKDFSKGSPEMSDSRSFTASKRRLHRFRSRLSGISSTHIITRRRMVSMLGEKLGSSCRHSKELEISKPISVQAGFISDTF